MDTAGWVVASCTLLSLLIGALWVVRTTDVKSLSKRVGLLEFSNVECEKRAARGEAHQFKLQKSLIESERGWREAQQELLTLRQEMEEYRREKRANP